MANMTQLAQQMKLAHQQNVEQMTPGFAAFGFIFEQHAMDAAFLWLMRSQVVYTSTLYDQQDIDELDQRINGHLDGLLAAGQSGWEICLQQLEMEDAGETFVAAVTAFNSGDTARMKYVCATALAQPEMIPGLVSALGWINEDIAKYWIDRFLLVDDHQYHYLAIASCSLRRLDPGQALVKLLQDSQIDQHPQLYARCIRLIGELKRVDLIPALNQAMNAEDQGVKFWAHWSALLLGNKSAAQSLKSYLASESPCLNLVLQLVFSSLSIEQARQLISELSADPANLRIVIRAAGALGEPQVIPWLIQQMHNPETARIAGLSFSLITGINLEQNRLDKDVEIEFVDNPEGDTEDDAENADSDLPWPDPIKIRGFWEKNGDNFQAGVCYFLGDPVSAASLNVVLQNGNQLQKSYAAVKLAVIESNSLLVNIASPTVSV